MGLDILDEIERIEKTIGKLSDVQKVLLATDGSVTTILEVLNGDVKIKTLKQKLIEADEKIAHGLGIKKGDLVNYRVVVIESDMPLIHATSFIPIKRLYDDFKEDLTKADIPIGKLLKKYNIEARREIEYIDVKRPDEELMQIFKIDSPMLTRTYNIIHKEEVLIRITETFPSTFNKG